jgi:hypothetical protein
VKLPALLIEGNDTSGAIRLAFTTMPPADQAELLAMLQPKAVRLRWLEPPVAARVVAILDDLDPASRDLIENLLLPQWQRACRKVFPGTIWKGVALCRTCAIPIWGGSLVV